LDSGIPEPGVTDTDFFNQADMERARLVAEGSKAAPAKVAQDGYDALLASKNKVVSNFMNKAQAVISNPLLNNAVSAQMHEQAEPVDGDERLK